MTKKLIALALIIIVALAAMQGLYLLLRRAHNARQTSSVPETTIEHVQVAEVRSNIADQDFHSAVKESLTIKESSIKEPAKVHFLRDKRKLIEEPVEGSQRFEDLPKALQDKFYTRREEAHAEMYARRFEMTTEEWNALTPKEQRLLIRKGVRQ